jgi:hypothetical protein
LDHRHRAAHKLHQWRRRQQAGLQEIRADFENIRQAWLWALAVSQVLSDLFYMARAFNHNAFSRPHDLEHRRDCLRQAVQIRREIGDRCNLCFSLAQLTTCLAEAGAFAEAEQALEEAVRVQHEIGKTPVYIVVLVFRRFSIFAACNESLGSLNWLCNIFSVNSVNPWRIWVMYRNSGTVSILDYMSRRQCHCFIVR